MNKKHFICGLLILFVFAFTLNSCSDPQDVNIVPAKAKMVDKVNVAQTTNTTGYKYAILTWKGVKDGTRYNIYTQIEGKNYIEEIYPEYPESSSAYNDRIYKTDDGSITLESDNTYKLPASRDDWTSSVSLYYITGGKNIGDIMHSEKKIRFGVRTYDINSSYNEYGYGPSDIKWSDFITLPVIVENN